MGAGGAMRWKRLKAEAARAWRGVSRARAAGSWRVAVWVWAVMALGCATVPEGPGLEDTYSHRWGVLGDDNAGGKEPAPAPLPSRRPQVRLRRRHGAPVTGTDVSRASPEQMARLAQAGQEPADSSDPTGPHVPAGWPDWDASDEELLAPFFECSTPAQFLRLQQGVDMARLLEELEDWSAVRLGALGPMDARTSEVLTRKRAAFILHATEAYGAASGGAQGGGASATGAAGHRGA
jgi:hypothetical protein